MKNIAWILGFLILLSACSSDIHQQGEQPSLPRVAEQQTADAFDTGRHLMSPQIMTEEDFGDEKPEVGIGSSYPNQTEELTVSYVKTVYYHKNKDLIAPQFLMPSEDAKQANQEIEKLIVALGAEFSERGIVHTTYNSILYGQVLSTLIQIDCNGEIDFIAYNFDVNSGQKLNVDALLKVAGLSWEELEGIFYQDRMAYWQGIRKLRGTNDKLDKYMLAEREQMLTLYQSGKLPLILDEDGLVNIVCALEDDNDAPYWQLYCITHNRTDLLQRNAYSGDFPMVVIAEPTAEEMSNIKLLKKHELKGDYSAKRRFLLLPLWENLNFALKERTLFQKEEKTLWQKQGIYVGEAIYMELPSAVEKVETFAQISLGESETIFSPFLHKVPDRGIYYLPFSEGE